MRRSLLLSTVTLALLLLGAGAGWWLRATVPPSGEDALGAVPRASATGAADAPPASVTAPQAPAAAMTAPTLPAPDQPVAQHFDALLARARGGDAGAACRLAADLQRCRHTLRRGPREEEAFEARAAREGDPQRRESMIRFLAELAEEQARAERLCAGLSPAQLDLAFALQLQAARARPALRVWLALSPALERENFVAELERWQQYRQVAQPWLEAAAAAGDVTALIALARIHGAEEPAGPAPPLRSPDDERFVVYDLLLERYGANLPPLRLAAQQAWQRLTPAQRASARLRAGALLAPAASAPTGDALSLALRRSYAPAPRAGECD